MGGARAAAILLLAPPNTRCATDSTNMQRWIVHNLPCATFVPADNIGAVGGRIGIKLEGLLSLRLNEKISCTIHSTARCRIMGIVEPGESR